MAKLLIVAGLAALAFAVFAVVDCALAPRRSMRGLPRWAWLLVILVLPVIGGALWFLIGSGRTQQAASGTRPIGPDDDPDFLRGRGARPAATQRPGDDEQWRRLEQELASLDSDADTDDEGDPRRR